MPVNYTHVFMFINSWVDSLHTISNLTLESKIFPAIYNMPGPISINFLMKNSFFETIISSVKTIVERQ